MILAGTQPQRYAAWQLMPEGQARWDRPAKSGPREEVGQPTIPKCPGVLADRWSLKTIDACLDPQGICAEVSFEYLLSIPPEATDVVT